MLAGALAMLMRTELADPSLQFLSKEQYNQLFTVRCDGRVCRPVRLRCRGRDR